MNKVAMTANAVQESATFPLRRFLPWAALGIVLSTAFVYFAGAEQGAMALFSGDSLHELMHDGRHLLGFPCH